MQSTIKTSILIVSDTHGMEFKSPSIFVDLVIHCGDLTDESKLEEFHTTIKCLSRISSPLKLVIAGNHDFTLDPRVFERKLLEAVPPVDSNLVEKTYGRVGEAQTLFEQAKDAGVTLLHEGNYQFTLANGALLTIYASPYTPSMGAWGFQYHPNKGHEFAIARGTDIAITHGPPRGVMDYTNSRERAGCPDLFAAVAEATPRIHCFGHIHEGWGAKQVCWRNNNGVSPTHFTAIDNEKSIVIEKLPTLERSRFDSSDDVKQKRERKEQYMAAGFVQIDQSSFDDGSEGGLQTLFVNAAMAGGNDQCIEPGFSEYVVRGRASGTLTLTRPAMRCPDRLGAGSGIYKSTATKHEGR